jgi:hypothetical protein
MKIERPQAENRHIKSKDDFELCYIRHRYFRRVDYNPTEQEMAPYMAIVQKQAKNTYYTYTYLFRMVGFDLEDVLNIARVHLVSFIGLYSLSKHPEKYDKFLAYFLRTNKKEATESDILDKNKQNLTMFLKQRMEDVVRVCRQKARNIRGTPTDEAYVFYGATKPPTPTKVLLDGHKKLGFRRLDLRVFKSIKKKLEKPLNNQFEPFKWAGYWYVAVKLENRMLSLEDFTSAGYSPYDTIHCKDPEQLLTEKVAATEFENKKAIFESSPLNEKRKMLLLFIEKNSENPKLKDEVSTAKRFIRNLRD